MTGGKPQPHTRILRGTCRQYFEYNQSWLLSARRGSGSVKISLSGTPVSGMVGYVTTPGQIDHRGFKTSLHFRCMQAASDTPHNSSQRTPYSPELSDMIPDKMQFRAYPAVTRCEAEVRGHAMDEPTSFTSSFIFPMGSSSFEPC